MAGHRVRAAVSQAERSFVEYLQPIVRKVRSLLYSYGGLLQCKVRRCSSSLRLARAPRLLVSSRRGWSFPGVADRLGAWSDLAGCDLIRAGTVGTADEIRDTAVAQPLLVAAALAAAGVLRHRPVADRRAGGRAQRPRGRPAGTRPPRRAPLAASRPGTASASSPRARSPAFSPSQDAIRLVGVRGRAMAAAAAAERTSMTAVLGGDEAAVLRSIEAHGLTPANINGAGQIVAAGTARAARGVRRRPAGRRQAQAPAGRGRLPHRAYGARRRGAARRGRHGDGAEPSADGAVEPGRRRRYVPARTGWSGSAARSAPRSGGTAAWRTMGSLGATAFLELPPAGTLVGLARRALPGIGLLAVKTPGRPRCGQGDARRARPALRQPRARVAAARRAAGGDVPVSGRARAARGSRWSAAPSSAGSRCAVTATW